MVYKTKDGIEVKSYYQTQTTTFIYDKDKKEWLGTYEVSQADWNEELNAWDKPLVARISVSTAEFEDANELVVEYFQVYMGNIGWNLENDDEDSPYLVKEE